MANQAEFSHQQQWPVRGRVKIFVNILISIYHLPCALHALSHVIFSPHNDAIFLSADICWFYKSGFQSHFFLLKIYWFSSRKKKSSCAFDRAVLCLLWMSWSLAWLRPDQLVFSIPLVSVIDRDGHVMCTRNKTQLQDISCNCSEKEIISMTIANRRGYRLGAIDILFVTMR